MTLTVKDKKRFSGQRNASRLSTKDVADIRKRREAGESFPSIHKDYQFVKEITVRQAAWNKKYYGKKGKT